MKRYFFSLNVKTMRTEMDLSQAQLAERAHLDVKTVMKVENGNGHYSLDTLYKLADAFECSPSTLLSESLIANREESINKLITMGVISTFKEAEPMIKDIFIQLIARNTKK